MTQQNQSTLAGRRILFLGDSITQNGAYVTMIEYYLNRNFPTQNFDLISIGLSSETASGLSEKIHPFPRPCVHERLARALSAIKPEVVVACYGMNDGIYHPQSSERFHAFQTGILKLVRDAQSAGAQVVLLTPPPFDALPIEKSLLNDDAPDFSYINPFCKYDQVLQEYSRWIMNLKQPGVTAADLHTPLNDYLKQRRQKDPRLCFCSDGIHPSAAGHLLMARAFLKALGVPLLDVDLDAELKAMQADRLFTLTDTHRQTRSSGWLDFVGYTRDTAVKKNSREAEARAAAKLQEEIDSLRRAHTGP